MKMQFSKTTVDPRIMMLFLSIAVLSSKAAWAAGGGAASSDAASDCSSLPAADFKTIPDAPTKVLSANYVQKSAELPAHCFVSGYVSPQVHFALKLPPKAEWNGKFFEHGIGHTAGVVRDSQCDGALRRGYACITTDTGHNGTDLLWAFNNVPAVIDYAWRGIHVTALAGKST